ncbi:MAG: lipase family protein [Actinomycetota bacterium]|nr:alpha/beta fold hydrolase [Geodermatophilaceae bacterium]MDQ3505580.1 lipase family protein [Actinomycetota bacterium]
MAYAVRRLLCLLLLASAIALGLAVPASAAPEQGSVGVPSLPGNLGIRGLPVFSPPGSNDFNCRPTPTKPYPVVLVHGTFADSFVSWQSLSPMLAHDGYCVFALDYGNRGTGPIETSATQLRDFIDSVLSATGAAKVSIVGHSQGGMMPRYYLRFLGGAAKVDELIGLSPSNHGTTQPLAPVVGPVCTACAQQVTGSPFLTNLNAGYEVEPGVDYTVLVTRYDEVVLPYRSQYLTGPAGQLTNITLQAKCPLDFTEHLLIIYDYPALQWVKHALLQDGPANPSFRPFCL